jgi:hypothetical protein
MSTYTIQEVIHSNDRYKLYLLQCKPNELSKSISHIQTLGINTINIGTELASFIDRMDNTVYLNFDVSDFLIKVLDSQKRKITSSANDVVALYNLGILLEPALELNATHLLKEYSKSTALIIIWENLSNESNVLNWLTQEKIYFLNFTELPLKKLHYEI